MKHMKKSYKISVPLFLFLSTSVLMNGCRQKQSDDEGSQSAAKAVVTVKVAPVNERDAAVVVEAIGKTDALRKEIEALGYEVRDTENGSRLVKKLF